MMMPDGPQRQDAEPDGHQPGSAGLSHTYAFLGRAVCRGLDAEALRVARLIPPLADHLGEDIGGEELAAQHHHLFRFEVFPHEGVFCDPSAQIGGSRADALVVRYREAGFPLALRSESADHLGVQLAFVGYLARVHAEAVQLDDQVCANLTQTQTREFLDEHLLGWLVALDAALAQQPASVHSTTVRLALELAVHHRQMLPRGGQTTLTLPPTPALVDDERTGLRDIATFLTTPAHAGLFIGRSDIRALARVHELPTGFGSRRLMMTNLLSAAAEYDVFVEVLGGIERLVEAHRSHLEQLAFELVGLARHCAVWSTRLAETAHELERFAADAVADEHRRG